VTALALHRSGLPFYGDEYVRGVEATSCSQGCRRALRLTPEDQRGSWGPGGRCDLLSRVYGYEVPPMPEFADDGVRVTCTAREPL